MGARCERLVGVAFEAFQQGAPERAREVETLDCQIDQDEVDIHALILRILALRQPVADDLRFLATALRLIIDVERIGDEAVNIAERVVEPDGKAKAIVAAELAAMALAARDMLREALDAFVRSDATLAAHVLESDDAIDVSCAAIISTMTEHISRSSSEARAGLRVIGVATYLERVADHATNIAEEVIFIVRGDDVRHGQWRLSPTCASDALPTRAGDVRPN
jgi:phosphate transport system protein